jgi:hypothetical protein
MNHPRIVLLGVVALIVMIILVSIGFSPKLRPGQVSNMGTGQSPFPREYAPNFSINAFLPSSGQISLGGGSPQNAEPPIFQGKPVTTLEDIAAIIGGAGAAPTTGNLLPLPNVSDAEIKIDASGAGNVIDYLTYFNTHAIDGGISFDNQRFEKVLKDGNGILLFTPDLIDKALAGNNFAEVHDSLTVQRDFALAEIAYLKSIRVTAGIASFHKEAIAMEELLIQLIDKTFAVEAGALSKSEFTNFYQKFRMTAESAHGQFVSQSGVLSLGSSGENFFARILRDLGFARTARAQTDFSFGGRIGLPVFCLCDAGFWVIVGPPKPASLFVPLAFVASPFFHIWRSLSPGVWWLGLYLPSAQIPCLSAFFCSPIGSGGLILTTGTSLF